MTALRSGKRSGPPLAAPAACDVRNYDFLRYVNKQRMVTFWYQLAEIMRLDVKSVLEVGIGPRIVAPVLRELGKEVKTADVNPALEPDYLVQVQRLSSVVPAESADVILCARVLHYVPPDELDQTFAELHRVTRGYVIVTLPVDELRLSFGFYVTACRWRWASIRMPLVLKRALLRLLPRRPEPTFGRTWKLDCRAGLTCADLEAKMSKLFTVEKSYAIPEVATHHLFLLSKRAP